MKRDKTPVINDKLANSAKLNQKAPKPKNQRFSWGKFSKRLSSLPWLWISIGVVVVVAVIFFGVSAHRRGDADIATRSALDSFLKERSSDITFNVGQSLYGSGDSPYKYSGTLSLRQSRLRARFSTSRDANIEYNKGRLSQTDFIADGEAGYLKFNIDSKLSYTGYDFKPVNDKWYRYNIGSNGSMESTLYTINQQLIVNNTLDPNRLVCDINSLDVLNDKKNRNAVVKALLDSKFIKLGEFKSDKKARYIDVSFDAGHYADFAKLYRQTAYAKKVQSCMPKNSADLFGSEIAVREATETIKKDKSNARIYFDGFVTSKIKRVEYNSNSDESTLGKLTITADFKKANDRIETPSRATEITGLTDRLVVSSGN